MPSVNSSGTLTTVVGGGEQTLATITTAGNYELNVDLAAMAVGDVVVVRAKKKVLSTGTTRTYLVGVYANTQSSPVAVTPPITCVNELVLTVEHTAGTSISVPWEVRAL